MHGVFPSSHNVSASARIIQFHRIYKGDSGEVVTPFMHVGTYPTRNFATLGPSELQPPFTGVLGLCVNIFLLPSGTGQVSVPIHPFSSLQRPVFLVNSRPSFFSYTSENNYFLGTPFPEVTESICRVPSLYFFRAPWFIQPNYLCRFEYGLFVHYVLLGVFFIILKTLSYNITKETHEF